MTDNDDLSRIEVELSLMSGQDSAAALALAESLKTIAGAFQALKTWDPSDQARKMERVMEQSRQQGKTVQDNAGTQGGRSEGGLKDYDTGVAATRVQQAHGREILDQYGLSPRESSPTESIDPSQAAERVAMASQQERARLEQESKENETRGEEARRKLGSLGGLRKSFGLPESPTTEMSDLDKESDFIGHAGQFTIPRFGELNIQDFFNFGRVLAMRRSRNQQEGAARQMLQDQDPDIFKNEEGVEDLSAWRRNNEEQWQNALGSAEQTGVGAGASDWDGRFARAASFVGGSHAVRGFYQKGREILARHDLDPGQMMARGGQLGFDRSGGDISVGGIGFQTPFSQAGAEGLRQSEDTIINRFKPGINQQQSEEITMASQEAGLSGEEGRAFRNDLAAPLVQRFGLDPKSLIPFTQILRTNTGTITQLRSAFDSLGNTARATKQSVDEVAQGLAAAGEAAQQSGGLYMQGVNFATRFSQTTGLPSSVGTEALSNGIVQGVIGAQSGVPGFMQGALSPGAKTQGIAQTVDMLYNSYRGAVKDTTRQIRDPQTGEVIATETTKGSDLAYGGVASTLGMSTDAVKALHERRGIYQADNALSVVRAYDNRGENLKRRDAHQAAIESYENNPLLNTYGLKVHHDAQGYYVSQPGEMYPLGGGRYPSTKKYITDDLNNQAKSWLNSDEANAATFSRIQTTARHDGKVLPGWDSVSKMVKQVYGSSQADQKEAQQFLDSVAHDDKNPHHQAERIEKKIQEKIAAANTPQMNVAFTGPAAKLFHAIIDMKGQDMGDWSKATNLPAGTARGPNPLSSNPAAGMGLSESSGDYTSGSAFTGL